LAVPSKLPSDNVTINEEDNKVSSASETSQVVDRVNNMGGPVGIRSGWITSIIRSWPYVLAILICVALLVKIYHLNAINLRVPLDSYGDGLYYQALFKNFIETGHYNVNPRLGAPGELELYDFPVPHYLHLAGIALIKLFTHNYELVYNLYYLASYPLVALTALYVLRRFKTSTTLAIALSILYAFLPFHLLRSELHYVLSCYFLIPLATMVALWLATGVPLFVFKKSQIPRPTRDGFIAIVTCLLLASDNPYFVFLTGILFVIGGLLGQFKYRISKTWVVTSILSTILVLALLLNLAPNLLYIRNHGFNPVTERASGDVEFYGLKVIQMLAPVTHHRIPALAKWKAHYNAAAPLINENDSSSLGLVGAIGFVALLGVFFAPRASRLLYCAAVLNVSAVLVATVGGFGSLFAFTVWKQFRSLNRMSLFIGFLSLLAVGTLIDQLIGRVPSRKRFSYALIPALLGIGLADQIPVHFRQPHAALEVQVHNMRTYFGRIEASVPADSMIFQLPYISFPLSSVPNQLALYEELFPYLYTSNLRWSFGSMGGRDADHWNSRVGNEPIPEMVESAAAAGFAGILIDRYGYADRASGLEAQIEPLVKAPPVVSADGRYAFFPLASVANEIKSRYDAATLDELAHPVYADMEKGCYPLEVVGEKSWNWCRSEGELVIHNPSKERREVTIEATIHTGTTNPVDIVVQGPGVHSSFKASNTGWPWKETLAVDPGASVYTFHSDAPPVVAPQDPRTMIFMVRDLKLLETWPGN